MRTVSATRYVTPLREGGSLPGLVEADDDGLYVLKFRGAGQGPKALLAEIVAGELARAVGLTVPEIVLVELDPELGRAEPDPEIQDLIAASGGLNVGLDFLPGALTYSPAAGPHPAPELAADIVWLDALVTNVDRSARNPNLLCWHGRLWLIDHGAALYLQHAWQDPPADAQRAFPAVRDHVLLPLAGSLAEADARLAPRIDAATVERDRGPRPGALVRAPGARRVRRLPVPPARAAARLRRRGRGGPPCPGVARSSTRSCASCRAWSAASASTRASCSSAARAASWRRARRWTSGGCGRSTRTPTSRVVRDHLEAFVRVAAGAPDAGPMARLEASERFHWLVAPSSTVLQCSPVHTGLTDDPEAELDRLLARLVG